MLSARPLGKRTGQSAATVLGRTHPLARRIDAAGCVGRQWWTCAAVLAVAVIARFDGDAWAVAVAVGASMVLLTLTVVMLALRQRARDEAIHLIAEGHEALPIAVVQRQRERLLSQRAREGLARSLETMLQHALRPPRIMTRGARPLFSVRVIASVAPDLRAVISVLQTGSASARGVALTERLITHANSPLYAREAIVLRDELHRIRGALRE